MKLTEGNYLIGIFVQLVFGVNNKATRYSVVNKCRRRHSIAKIPQRKRGTLNDLNRRQVHSHGLEKYIRFHPSLLNDFHVYFRHSETAYSTYQGVLRFTVVD